MLLITMRASSQLRIQASWMRSESERHADDMVKTWSEQATATLSASDNALYLEVWIAYSGELLDRCSCDCKADGDHMGEVTKP